MSQASSTTLASSVEPVTTAPRLHLQASLRQARIDAVRSHTTRPSNTAPPSPVSGSKNGRGGVPATVQASAALQQLPRDASQWRLSAPVVLRAHHSTPRSSSLGDLPDRQDESATNPTHEHRFGVTFAVAETGPAATDAEKTAVGGREVVEESGRGSADLRAETEAPPLGGTVKKGSAPQPGAVALPVDDDSTTLDAGRADSDSRAGGCAEQPGRRETASDAVAARVLASLKRKDEAIKRLTEQIRLLTEEGAPSLSPDLSLAAELERKEGELRELREHLMIAQQQWELKGVALEAKSREAAMSYAQIRALETQLDDALQEKREEVTTLRERVEQLQRDLRSKTMEAQEREREHRAELKALQKDIAALTEEFEAQLGTAEERQRLADALAAAKRREEDLVFENRQMQRRWLQELDEQKRLVDDLQRSSSMEHAQRVEESAQVHSGLQERQQLTWELERSRAQLHELTHVHRRSEELVAELRLTVQQLTNNVATLVLERDAATTEAEALQARLAEAERSLQAQDAEMTRLAERHAAQLDSFLAKENGRQASMLSQVEGCVQSTKQLESALATAEAGRAEMEQRALKAEAEATEALSQHRQREAQTRQDMLEQQQLANSARELLHGQLTAAQRALTEQASELADVRQQLTEARAALAESATERAHVDARHAERTREHVELRQEHERTTASLLSTTHELHRTLAAQLAAERRVEAMESRLAQVSGQQRGQREALHTTQERLRVLVQAAQETAVAAAPLLSRLGQSSMAGGANAGAGSCTHGGPPRASPSHDPQHQQQHQQLTRASMRAGHTPTTSAAAVEALLHGTDCLLSVAPLPDTASDVSQGQAMAVDSAEAVSATCRALEKECDTVGGGSVSLSAEAPGSECAGLARLLSTTTTVDVGTALRQLRALKAGLAALAPRWAHLERDLRAAHTATARHTREAQQLRDEVRTLRERHEAALAAVAEERRKRAASTRARAEASAAVLAEARERAAAETASAVEAERRECARRWAAEVAARENRERRAIASMAAELLDALRELPSAVMACVARQERADLRGVGARARAGRAPSPSPPSPPPSSALARDLVDECDTITRELLGLAGGYAELSSLAAPASVAVPPSASPWTAVEHAELVEVVAGYIHARLCNGEEGGVHGPALPGEDDTGRSPAVRALGTRAREKVCAAVRAPLRGRSEPRWVDSDGFRPRAGLVDPASGRLLADLIKTCVTRSLGGEGESFSSTAAGNPPGPFGRARVAS